MTDITISAEEHAQLLRSQDMLKACQERSAILKGLIDVAAIALGTPSGDEFEIGAFMVACRDIGGVHTIIETFSEETSRLNQRIEELEAEARGAQTFVAFDIEGPRSNELIARLLEVLGPARTSFKDWKAADIIERLKDAYGQSHAGVLTTTVRDILEAYEKDPDNAEAR